MAQVFDELLLKGIRQGEVPARTKAAREWYRNKAKAEKNISENDILQGQSRRKKSTFDIGTMCFFLYDPKHKATLPYYDRFPLIFPVDIAKDGFYGLNFHYLPLPMRARLMDALYGTVTNERYDETTKIKASYGILKSAAKYRHFRPTFKHYLSSHVRSQFIVIEPSEWDIALFLPVEDFKKQSKTAVWKESRKIIRNAK